MTDAATTDLVVRPVQARHLLRGMLLRGEDGGLCRVLDDPRDNLVPGLENAATEHGVLLLDRERVYEVVTE